MIQGKPAIDPEFPDLIDMQYSHISNDIRVALPGSIWTYNPETRTAQVVPGYNRVYNDGTVKKAPILVDVPVFTLQGGGIHVGMPIQSGDECLIVFSDINIDAWFEAGGQQTPLDGRRHDISDGFAIVGFNSKKNPIQTMLEDSEGGLASEMAEVAIDRDTGLIAVKNANGKSLAVSLASLMTTLSALNVALASMNIATITAGTTQATIGALSANLTTITADIAALLKP